MKALSKRNRAFVRQLVVTEFKLKYQGSVLGYMWSLMKPIMLFGVLYFVFTQVVRVGDSIENYPTYLLLGIVMWIFFTEATMGGLGAIVGRGDMIRKVNIPKFAIVLSTSLSASVNFSLNLLVVLVFMYFTGVDFRLDMFFLPLYVLELFVFATALGLFMSALFVKFRDIAYIWEVVLQMGFYITPIIYTMSFITDLRLQQIVLLNPLAHVIQGARQIMITPQTVTGYEIMGVKGDLIPIGIILGLAVFSVWFFRRKSAEFAEYI